MHAFPNLSALYPLPLRSISLSCPQELYPVTAIGDEKSQWSVFSAAMDDDGRNLPSFSMDGTVTEVSQQRKSWLPFYTEGKGITGASRFSCFLHHLGF